jgi:magnesium chelatase family protein
LGQRERLAELDRQGKLMVVGSYQSAIAEPDAEGRGLLTRAAERLGLSARAWHRTLRVARTLADLDGSDWWRR